METETLHCYSCGGSFAREELQYRPSERVHTVSKPITALYAMRSKRKKKRSQLQSHHSETHYQPDQQQPNYGLRSGINKISFS